MMSPDLPKLQPGHHWIHTMRARLRDEFPIEFALFSISFPDHEDPRF